ncbi:MAG: ornithine carbamoyltransferase [Cyanobacteria bacterium NC_groundwater_1444_Ag_S-0.65um_54_12]|nr:ornithine carbamoyltransferase [Cyanobacteria bacterium NC_groundwater_1444_Ag_S-0.65um_54_12]
MLITEEKRSALHGKDLITTQDWNREELDQVLAVASELQRNRYDNRWSRSLLNRTFFMFFYNPSVRTRQSFECAATELSGHAQFLEPKAMRLKTANTAGETIEDAARVMSRYACGIGIRILEDQIGYYGAGDELLREYARWSEVPIVSMAHDKYHPCQGLADIMGIQNHMGDPKGKTLLLYWGHGALARSWCSVQEALLLYPRYGMNVVLAHPEGYDLDPAVVAASRQYAKENGASFQISHDPVECFADVDLVYARNWMSPQAYRNGELQKSEEIQKALAHSEWICDAAKLKRGNDPFFIHPMPVDRGHEVTDEIASGPKSLIIDVAECRLHVQKALLALTMGN